MGVRRVWCAEQSRESDRGVLTEEPCGDGGHTHTRPPLHQPKNVGCAVGCDLPGTLLDPTAEGDRGLKGLQKSATEDLGKGVGNNP